MMTKAVISNQADHMLGKSDNRRDYEDAFLHRVHRLLQLAYGSLQPGEYAQAEEEDITGDLKKHMRHLTEQAPTEGWMALFSVHEEDPVDDVPSASTGKRRKGKRRPKIDVRIVGKQIIPNRTYSIEAKRLYRGDSVAEYLGKDGLRMFLDGQYAIGDDRAGMMGYVQSGTIAGWAQRLGKKLHWTRVTFRKGPLDCFQSEHDRDNGSRLRLVHVMFHFAHEPQSKGERTRNG